MSATALAAPVSDDQADARRWLATDRLDEGAITRAVADPVFRPAGRAWWIALAITLPFCAWTVGAIAWLLVFGIGTWGVNTTIVWGFAIANYVWWIGIGNAGTLISSMLLLTRQRWRSSINRFAEAMTLFAAAIAGIFPVIHLGRPLYAYWLAPYPNTMVLWPQPRSALVWDFWAILSYILFSALFWYLGALPDFATMRDRARSRAAQVLYGVAAMGWRGSARHWRHYGNLQMAMAACAVPLVCSVHSIVGLDFAASLMPGWTESIFPPYFVVGAMFSGFAMVVVLAVAIRWGLRLQAVITLEHFDVMAKVMLMASVIMGYSYATEWFSAWYGGDRPERSLTAYLFTGDYAPMYWALIACNVVVPQLLWFPRVRRFLPGLVAIAIAINIGMWLERILIVWTTLSHGYAAPLYRVFHPGWMDWSLTLAPLGVFAFLFLVFVRLVPVVSMSELRELARTAGVAGTSFLPPSGSGAISPRPVIASEAKQPRASAAQPPRLLRRLRLFEMTRGGEGADNIRPGVQPSPRTSGGHVSADSESGFLAEFADPDALRRGLATVVRAGHRALDAFTPCPVEGLDGALGAKPSHIRPVMLAAGLAVAVLAFGLQWYSSVWGYPINSGGRPLNSWPVFLLVPFEVGILAAGIGGFIAFFKACGLPRLHHPLFSVPDFERTTQDRFFLLAYPGAGSPDANGSALRLRHLLEGAGALAVNEVRR